MTTAPQITWTGQLKFNLLEDLKRASPPQQSDKVAFGLVPAPHMLTAKYAPETGWEDAEIRPFEAFTMMPDSVAFHYGQQIFEGLKAYRSKDDSIFLFRPELNARRLFKSAVRIGMAPVPEDMFLKCVKALVNVEREWVLHSPWSLYIRPFIIPLDRGVSLRPSRTYLFTVILSPVNAYYSNPDGIAVMIERKLVRAAPGGVGEAKCGGNYAASLFPMAQAKTMGAEQILWLDASEHEYVEEVGAMNIMFVYGKKIITPKLSGSILPGVTRDSILKLAPTLGFEIEEKRIKISTVLSDIASGAMTECFGCGTAAVVSPIDFFIDSDPEGKTSTHRLNPQNKVAGQSVALALKAKLTEIQNGTAPDPFSWRVSVP